MHLRCDYLLVKKVALHTKEASFSRGKIQFDKIHFAKIQTLSFGLQKFPLSAFQKRPAQEGLFLDALASLKPVLFTQ